MEKGFDRGTKQNLTIFCRISRFFFMGLQIFLYQGLAGVISMVYVLFDICDRVKTSLLSVKVAL